MNRDKLSGTNEVRGPFCCPAQVNHSWNTAGHSGHGILKHKWRRESLQVPCLACLEGAVILASSPRTPPPPLPCLGFRIKRKRQFIHAELILWEVWDCVHRWICFEAHETEASNSSSAWVLFKALESPGNLSAWLYVFAKFVNLRWCNCNQLRLLWAFFNHITFPFTCVGCHWRGGQHSFDLLKGKLKWHTFSTEFSGMNVCSLLAFLSILRYVFKEYS